jgi:hypothetical protein
MGDAGRKLVLWRYGDVLTAEQKSEWEAELRIQRKKVRNWTTEPRHRRLRS